MNDDNVVPDQELAAREEESTDLGVSPMEEEARQIVLAISTDADKLALPNLLRPALELLAELDPATAETYLSRLIGPRFGLRSEELSAYRATMAQIRRERAGAQRAAAHEGPVQQAGENFIARFPGLVDVVQRGDDLVFAVMRDGHLADQESTRIGGVVYVPPPPGQLPWHGRGIPRWEKAYGAWRAREDPAELFKDVIDYLKTASHLPGEGYYVLLATWVFLSYLADHPQVKTMGYIYLYAVKERGKTRTLEALANVAYRTTFTETVNPAPLFRFADYLGGTLLEDTTDFWEAVVRKGAEDFFLSRFEKGKAVHRVKRQDAAPFKDLGSYEVFGPTAIATNHPVPNVLESRCFPIRMPAAPGRYAWPDSKKGLELRERLLAWRAGHMEAELPSPLTVGSGRFADISAPLSQVLKLVDRNALPSLVKALLEIRQLRHEQEGDTLEGRIVQAIVELEQEDAVQSGRLAISKVRERLGQGMDKRYWPSPQRVGHALTALGFSRSKDRKWLLWDEQFVKRLEDEYGI